MTTINYSWIVAGLTLIALAVTLFNGKSSTRKTAGVLTAILLISAFGLFMFAPNAGFVAGGGNSLAITGGQTSPQQTVSTGNGINIVTTNPTVSVTGRNSQYTGTTFSASTRVSVNSGAFGAVGAVTSAVPGQTFDMLVNASGYHNAIVPSLMVQADTFPLTVDMNKNASVTITAFNTNNQVIDNTATNQSVSTGFSPNMNVKFNGQSQSDTQDMTCVLEESNKTAIDTTKGIVMQGATPVTIPLNFYTLAGVNSYVQAYDISALTDSSDVFHAIQVNTATTSGYSLAGSTLTISCYTKEHFIDASTGKFAFAIQDSTGALQSIAKYAKTIQFT